MNHKRESDPGAHSARSSTDQHGPAPIIDRSIPSSPPLHCIAICPICGGGLCGIRICTGDDPTEAMPQDGFVMCDECEAVWLEPNVHSEHVYMDARSPKCPICQAGLWAASRWADRIEIESLGWSSDIDVNLDGSD